MKKRPQPNRGQKRLSSILKVREVVPRLYLGNKDAAKDLGLLRDRLGVTHIVNIGGGRNYFPDDMEYLKFRRILDNGDSDIQQCFAPMYVFISQALAENDNNCVLVHCRGGISRSPVLICAYLLQSRACTSVDEALALVRRSKPAANPNPASLDQLKQFADWSNSARNDLD